MKQNMSIREVAKELGTSQQTVRIGIQQKVFTF